MKDMQRSRFDVPPASGLTLFADRVMTLVYLHRSTTGAVALRLLGAFLSFLTILLVARASGASVTGEFALAMSTAAVASLLALMGLDQITTRLVGGDLRQGRTDMAWASLFATSRLILPVSLGITVIVYLLAPLGESIKIPPEAIRAVALSIFASNALRIAVVTLRATGAIYASQFFDSAHNLLILLAILIAIYGGSFALNSTNLAAIYSASLLTTATLAWIQLWSKIRIWERGATLGINPLRYSWPVLVSAFSQSVGAWGLMALIGAWLGSAEVGAYRVANQTVSIIVLMIATIETLAGPDLAGDFRTNNIKGAWRRHRQATYLMLLAGGIPVLACLVFPQYVLMIFGREFTVAAGALMILSAGQLVSTLAGPIGGVMVMSGNERVSLYLSILSLVVMIGLALAVVPVLGINGAALAGAIGVVIRNILAFALMRRRLKY